MAIAGIVGIAWKFHNYLKAHVADEVKPIKENLESVRAEVRKAEDRVLTAEAGLTIFRLEVARTYTTKEDVMNSNKPVLDSVERLTHSVDNMNTRIDRVIEQSNAAKPAARRRAPD